MICTVIYVASFALFVVSAGGITVGLMLFIAHIEGEWGMSAAKVASVPAMALIFFVCVYGFVSMIYAIEELGEHAGCWEVSEVGT